MVLPQETTFVGTEGDVHLSVWDNPRARHVVVIAHGYGEHVGRYGHVADALVARGAAVYAADHIGHGRSAGDRVVITDFEHVVDDLHTVVSRARSDHPGLPVVLIGHSMGGLVATRFAQRHGDELAGLVLSGPAVGDMGLSVLLELEEIPEVPIDPDVLSRDPAVGAAYATDPLVWHGAFQRPTVEAWARAHEAVTTGPGFGELPVLWIHGEDDQLVPLATTQPAVERLAGRLARRLYPGARHELFNETNREEVLAEVLGFVDEVTARG